MRPPVTTRRIPETIVPGKPLGRHVRHDPKSLAFLVDGTDQPATKFWTRYTPILDQGTLGSCVGNAAAGLLGTAPFYGRLAAKRAAGLTLDEPQAVRFYSRATQFDPFDGEYPPTDTGTDGLSVAKAVREAGLIGSYLHITSLAAAHNAIKSGPFLVGTNWYGGFDHPNSYGVVTIGGSVRGGHEYECLGYSLVRKMWKFAQSWSPRWGRAGYFYYSDDTFTRLLAEQGDATVFVS